MAGNRSKKTEKYRQMLNNTATLCKSQVYNEIYSKLKRDNRLNRFIAVVQYCSIKGYDIEDSVKFISRAFPGYIDEKLFTAECFEDMIKSYGDISMAWGYGPLGDEITDIAIKNKAVSLIEKTNSIADIETYNNIYHSVDKVSVEENKGTTFNFNLSK